MPSLGKGPRPKMKHGPSTMLSAFANHNTRMAIAASPAPRKIALIMNSMTTVALQPSMIRVNQSQQRLSQTNRGHRIRSQIRNPLDIDDGEDALHTHFEHHRNCEQDD